MKNIIILITILICSKSFAQSYEEGIYFWKNFNKKQFSYYVKPKLEIKIEKLDAGVDDYYGLVSIKTVPNLNATEKIKELAGGLKLKNLVSNIDSTLMDLKFELLNTPYEIPVMNFSTGPGVDESFFINKKTFTLLKKSKNFNASFNIKISPLVSTIIESKKLPANTCKNLKLSGLKLKEVALEYQKLEDKINSMSFKNSETRRRLLNEVESKCFYPNDFYIRSFTELMNTEVEIKDHSESIYVELTKDEYQEQSLYLDFSYQGSM